MLIKNLKVDERTRANTRCTAVARLGQWNIERQLPPEE
jgi:hypothetical protein